QVAATLVLPWAGAASVSSPGFCRQNTIAQPKYSSTPMITGVAITASTVMSVCWLAAELDCAPGGMCGPQTSATSRQPMMLSTIQMVSSHRPSRRPPVSPAAGAAGAPGAPGAPGLDASAAIRPAPPSDP